MNGIRDRGKSHDVRGPGFSLGTGNRLEHKLDSAPETLVFRRVLIDGEEGVDQKSSALAIIAHVKRLTRTDKCLANETSAI